MTPESCPRCFAPAGEDGRPDCACAEIAAVTPAGPPPDATPREEAAPADSGPPEPAEAGEPDAAEDVARGADLLTRPYVPVPEIPEPEPAQAPAGRDTHDALPGEPAPAGGPGDSADRDDPPTTPTEALPASAAAWPALGPAAGGPPAPLPAGRPGPPAPRRRRPGAVLVTAAAAVVAAAAVAVGTGLLGGGSDDAGASGRSASGVALPAAPGGEVAASGAARVDGSPSTSPSASASASDPGSSPTASASVSASGSGIASPRTSTSATAGSPTASSGVPSHSPSGPPVLREGDSGPQVVELQKRLGQLFLAYIGPDDGVYDGDVANAVARYQRAHGITGDPSGVYGPATRKDLESRTHTP